MPWLLTTVMWHMMVMVVMKLCGIGNHDGHAGLFGA